MPKYDYCCEATGHIVEVSHRITESIATWGELCERAGVPCGDIPADMPVKKLITNSHVVHSTNLGSGQQPSPCQMGGCGQGMCQMS